MVLPWAGLYLTLQLPDQIQEVSNEGVRDSQIQPLLHAFW